MFVLRIHIKPLIFDNIFSKIEKTVNTFSIFEKFLYRAHISKILYILPL